VQTRPSRKFAVLDEKKIVDETGKAVEFALRGATLKDGITSTT